MSVFYGLLCVAYDKYTELLDNRQFCRRALLISALMSLVSLGLSVQSLWSPPFQVLTGLLLTLPCLYLWANACRMAWRAL